MHDTASSLNFISRESHCLSHYVHLLLQLIAYCDYYVLPGATPDAERIWGSTKVSRMFFGATHKEPRKTS